MTHVPPSILFLLNRIEHYKKLRKEADKQSTKLCYDLVVYELEDILDLTIKKGE